MDLRSQPDLLLPIKMLRDLRSVICTPLGFALLLIHLLDATELPAEDVGLVLKLKGEWLLNGKTIAPGQRLPAGGKIYHAQLKPNEAAPKDYISVVFFNGTIETRSWDDTESWNNPIQLPRAPKEAPSRWNQIVNAVMGVFPGHPEKYTQMSVRGPTTDLQDAVVELNNGQLDLRAVLRNLNQGQYRIVFQPIQDKSTLGKGVTAKPIVFDWNSNTGALLRTQEIQPGLYRLRIENARSTDMIGSPLEAWILVSNHAQYQSTATAFEECISLTKQWAAKLPGDAARSFCRAYLDSLAAEQNR